MTYTTKSNIPVITVLPAGTPPTEVTPYNYHAAILNGIKKNMTSGGVVVVQPTASADGHITINVPLTLGVNIVRLSMASNNDLDVPVTLTSIATTVVTMVEDATKVQIGGK